MLEKNIADTRKNILEKLLETDFAEIEAIKENKIIIMTAHRESVIQAADKVVEIGTAG